MERVFRTVGWWILGLVAIVQVGCALAVAGAAVGAGTAGYLYYNGLLYRDYHANLGDAVAATRTSLVELQFPLLKEKNDTGSAYFQTATGTGDTVRIYLDTVPSAIPLEGALTRISVRVGFSGDDEVSARILDQISKHLVSPSALPASTAPTAQPLSTTVSAPGAAPRPVETTPPPLAGSGSGDRLVPIAASGKR